MKKYLFLITISIKCLHCTCLETLIRQLLFDHQNKPFNFPLTWWFLSGETSLSGPLARTESHTRLLVISNGKISPGCKFFFITSITASSKETCIQEKWSFFFQVLNYFWKWIVLQTLKLTLCLSLLYSICSQILLHITIARFLGATTHRFWVNLGWNPRISTFQKLLLQYFCTGSAYVSNDYIIEN